MFTEILRFEIWYRWSRPATYVYFIIVFLLAFLVVVSPSSRTFGSLGAVTANSPYIVAYITITFSTLFTVITSAIMGVAIVRDFEHNTEAILSSTALGKMDYLLGRFFGSLVIVCVIHAGVFLGMMFGFSVSHLLPWEVAWKGKALLPFSLWNYLQPYLLFTVFNSFTLGAFFFMTGALWRNTVILYTQGIAFLILYQVSNLLFSDLELKQLISVIDPFGFRTFQAATLYWTPNEQNTTLVQLSGDLLINRAIWLCLGVIALAIACSRFSFSTNKGSAPTAKRAEPSTPPELVAVPEQTAAVHQDTRTAAYVRQLGSLSAFYFRMVWRERPFIAIVISGLLLLVVNAMKLNQLNGTSSHPTTNSVLNMLSSSFDVFLVAIAILYTAELLWKDRIVKFNLIADATPVPGFVSLMSKLIGLGFVYVSLLGLLGICGIMVQLLNHYYDINFGAYLKTLFGQSLVNIMLVTALATFIQVVVNNKFVGITLTVIAIVLNGLLTQFGLEHSLWRFGSGSLGVFSDMNAYGHFVQPFVWLKSYWISFAGILVVVAILIQGRGAESKAKIGRAFLQLRSNRSLLLTGAGFLASFVVCGSFIYYNTKVVNVFDRLSDRGGQLAAYEKLLVKYDGLIQPEISEVKLHLELFPSERDFTANGSYQLKNNSSQAISEIHVQHSLDKQLSVEEVAFGRPVVLKESSEPFRYYVYELAAPLQPGDTLRMDFKISFQTEGFQDGRTNTDIVYNGTFFNNSYFPSLGYNHNLSLQDEDLRVKHGLGSRKRLPGSDDEAARNTNLFGDDAHRILLEATIGTSGDQIAIAPGRLTKEWKVGDRNYFTYATEMPVGNFYSIVSARYDVKVDNWRSVKLEVYHHPSHTFNLDRMMEAMKDALAYNTENFGAFQFDALRIMEFPRYTPSAQSFATAIPFSEGLGFVMKVADPRRDLDMVYYLTAHEVSHQWWGHQVMEAEVQGGTMLSESLSQYSALMVMKKKLSVESLQKYLRYELDRYLAGRRQERRREQPLMRVEKQPYIHYNKASLVFFALQDYIGEDSLNVAIRRYLQKWANRRAPYPTSIDLVNEIKKVTPDSLQQVIGDMFESITIFENQATSAIYEQKSSREYVVTLKTQCKKFLADSIGVQQETPLDDWMDIGIYANGENGPRLIYLKKHRVLKSENTFRITVNEKPAMAGIDPLYKLIDRHSGDNTVQMRSMIDFDVFAISH